MAVKVLSVGACDADTELAWSPRVPPAEPAARPQAVTASAAAATPVTSLGRIFMTVCSFGSGGRRSAAQNEQNLPPLRSGCGLVAGLRNPQRHGATGCKPAQNSILVRRVSRTGHRIRPQGEAVRGLQQPRRGQPSPVEPADQDGERRHNEDGRMASRSPPPEPSLTPIILGLHPWTAASAPSPPTKTPISHPTAQNWTICMLPPTWSAQPSTTPNRQGSPLAPIPHARSAGHDT